MMRNSLGYNLCRHKLDCKVVEILINSHNSRKRMVKIMGFDFLCIAQPRLNCFETLVNSGAVIFAPMI